MSMDGIDKLRRHVLHGRARVAKVSINFVVNGCRIAIPIRAAVGLLGVVPFVRVARHPKIRFMPPVSRQAQRAVVVGWERRRKLEGRPLRSQRRQPRNGVVEHAELTPVPGPKLVKHILDGVGIDDVLILRWWMLDFTGGRRQGHVELNRFRASETFGVVE
mgnify:CR=1 FL=1